MPGEPGGPWTQPGDKREPEPPFPEEDVKLLLFMCFPMQKPPDDGVFKSLSHSLVHSLPSDFILAVRKSVMFHHSSFSQAPGTATWRIFSPWG